MHINERTLRRVYVDSEVHFLFIGSLDANASELEMSVLTQLELGRIFLQQHLSWLAAEYHLSAIKLLQNSMLLSGKKKTAAAPKKRHLLYVSPLCETTAVNIFSTRCNIYISRLCYDVSVHLSVRLSV